ncbi:hypothetical protein Mapa_008040 [Marchantia paleacea]|nr:hypothetical protein Mapa_008040 [Marchantia paleacea]
MSGDGEADPVSSNTHVTETESDAVFVGENCGAAVLRSTEQTERSRARTGEHMRGPWKLLTTIRAAIRRSSRTRSDTGFLNGTAAPINPKSSFSVAAQLTPPTPAHTASIIEEAAECGVRTNPLPTGEGGPILKSETAHQNLFPVSVSNVGPAFQTGDISLDVSESAHQNSSALVPALVSDVDPSFQTRDTSTEPLGAQGEMGPTDPSLELVSVEHNHPPALEIEPDISEGTPASQVVGVSQEHDGREGLMVGTPDVGDALPGADGERSPQDEGSDTVMPYHYLANANANVFEQSSELHAEPIPEEHSGWFKARLQLHHTLQRPFLILVMIFYKMISTLELFEGDHFVQKYVSDQSHLDRASSPERDVPYATAETVMNPPTSSDDEFVDLERQHLTTLPRAAFRRCLHRTNETELQTKQRQNSEKQELFWREIQSPAAEWGSQKHGASLSLSFHI